MGYVSESVIAGLREHQRERVRVQKVRMKLMNQLRMFVAIDLGYTVAIEDKKERQWFQEEAGKLIRDVYYEKKESPSATLIHTIMPPIDAIAKAEAVQEKAMMRLAWQLPVYDWCCEPQQRGFGTKNLAVIVGEAGDLANYSTVGKLWRRFGLAPWTFDDRCKMGSAWNRGGGLPAEEWTKFGYSPRRRAVAFNVGDPLLKLNKSIYRARYDASRAKTEATRPDWKLIQHHLHAHLLMTKLMFKHLFCQWNHWPVHDPCGDAERKVCEPA